MGKTADTSDKRDMDKTAGMLLFLSKYNPKSEEKGYSYKKIRKTEGVQTEEIMKYKGVQTNDAPAKHLLKMSKDEDQTKISKIFCIVSKEVYQDDFFQFSAMIKAYADRDLGYSDLEIIPIPYDFHFDSNYAMSDVDSEKMAVHIYRQIEAVLKEDERVQQIYIDYTGGFRDINFLMTVIIRYLEFEGISCKRIVYSNYQKQEILDIRYIYEMFEIVNGVNEFIGTGNARKLVEISEKMTDGKVEGKNKVKSFIQHIQNFSDAMSICNIRDIDSALVGIVEGIIELENDESEDIFIQMLKTLLPTIKQKMYVKDGKISDLDLIFWCLENNMLQQAATIYVEKMLRYYYDFSPEFRAIADYPKKYSGGGAPCKEEDLKKFQEGINKNLCRKNIVELLKKEFGTSIIVDPKDIKHTIQQIKSISSVAGGAFENIYNKYKNGTIDDPRMPKDMKSFLKKFFGNNSVIEEYAVSQFKRPKNTDEEAVDALKLLEDQNLELWKAMKYYHTIRIIRNNINHANGNIRNAGSKMKEYLEAKGIENGKSLILDWDDKTIEWKKKVIYEILHEGALYSKEICDKK